MTALSVAINAGLSVTRKGSRSWACCPLHGEKTASLCFFPDGRFYCFGCHAHGDGADLYAALYGVSLGEALRAVNGDTWKPATISSGVLLKHKVEAWRDEKRADAVRRLHLWNLVLAMAEEHNSREVLLQMDAFYEALAEEAKATDELNLLDSATPALLLNMITEEGHAKLLGGKSRL